MQVSNYDMFSGLVQFVNNRSLVSPGSNNNELTTSLTNPGLELANERLGSLVDEQRSRFTEARSNAIESGSAAFASEDLESRVSELRDLASQASDTSLTDEERADIESRFNTQRDELNERFSSLIERSDNETGTQRDIRDSFSALQDEASFINEIDISDAESLEQSEEGFEQFQESAQQQRGDFVESREDFLASAQAAQNDTDEIDRAREQVSSLEQASTQAQEIQQQISQSGAFVTQSQANISQAFAVSLLT
ncbi:MULTISPECIES: hypothetical protein [Gammaproteobacteria]|uniref:hypothetical protein n=1 Tax=Gammaproteobacteria TaxID=1236 RepID=UPI000DCFD64E|nr:MULTISPECIES: hypothetical protein [Gammaproteobacteria]RTE85748.1 hypothetical protein DQX04_09870 [Aliidiomarina sp. B3213]TCZ90250.1 hypothetical protein EYQ95_10585 [Lysobacter sp. N42]